MRRMSCVAAVLGVFAVGASSAGASSGPPTPSGCTFSNGTTVCETKTVTTSVSGPRPAPEYGEGCTETDTSTSTTVTFTAHRGAPDSQGQAVTPPPSYGTGSLFVSVTCPPNPVTS